MVMFCNTERKNTFLSNSSEISLNFEYSPTITPGLGGKQRKKKNNKNILDELM